MPAFAPQSSHSLQKEQFGKMATKNARELHSHDLVPALVDSCPRVHLLLRHCSVGQIFGSGQLVIPDHYTGNLHQVLGFSGFIYIEQQNSCPHDTILGTNTASSPEALSAHHPDQHPYEQISTFGTYTHVSETFHRTGRRITCVCCW